MVDADRLAELDAERSFLLRSLADLEREHEAGDVDDVDYRTLRDGYVARAAATLREIERGVQPPPAPPKRWGRTVGWVAVVVVIAVATGLVLARSWGTRGASDASQSGGMGNDGSPSSMLSRARSLMSTDPVQAIGVFGEVLDIDPDNVEAITYGAWLSVASALQSGNQEFFDAAAGPALGQFDQAIALDPTYADPHCFKAVVVFYRDGGNATDEEAKADPDVAARRRAAAAAAEPFNDECLALDPPQVGRGLAEALGTRIDGILAGDTSTAATTP